MINYNKLDDIIAGYKEYFPTHWMNEKYKWIAVKHFQDNWDIDAPDFAGMLRRALAKTENLLASINNFPARMILVYAKLYPEEVREAFRELFDESLDVSKRITDFKNKGDEWLERTPDNAKQHYQNEYSITVYLWLRYPDKYYIYKYSEARNTAQKLESDYVIKKGKSETNAISAFDLYNEIRAVLQTDEEVKQMFAEALTDDCYPDPELVTLTIDVGFYVSRFYNKPSSEDILDTTEDIVDITESTKATDTKVLLLAWNPKNYDWENEDEEYSLDTMFNTVKSGRGFYISWRCVSTKIKCGDTVFFIRYLPFRYNYELVKIALCSEELSEQNAAACCTAESVVGEAYELVIVLRILAETSRRNCHAALDVAVEFSLRTVVLLEVVDELLGSARELELLRYALEVSPQLEYLLLGGLVLEAYEYSSRVTVGNRHAEALCRDVGRRSFDNFIALYLAPNLERLLLGLLFLAADVRDEVVDHFRPCLKVLASARDSLICAREHVLQTELSQRVECGNIALNRAVGLDSDEASLCAETLALSLDYLDVLGVYLGHYHGNVGSETMSGVIRYYRALSFSVLLLESLYFVFFHIYCAEAEIYHGCYLLDIRCSVEKNHVLHCCGHGNCHLPAAACCLLIRLTCASRRSGKHLDIEPRVIFEQRCEALSDHARSTDNSNVVLFHNDDSFKKFFTKIRKPVANRSIMSYNRNVSIASKLCDSSPSNT